MSSFSAAQINGLSNARHRAYLEQVAEAAGGRFVGTSGHAWKAGEIILDDGFDGGDDGGVLSCHLYRQEGEMRVRFRGEFPGGRPLGWARRGTKEITVATRRGPAVAAAEIKRRLLGEYRRDLAAYRAALEEE